jgi:Armadillo/beta-catenin-like repeat
VLLTWLDLDWYPITSDDCARMKDNCITCVCQMVSNLAAQADFRTANHSKSQELILGRLVNILESVPHDPTSRESSALHSIFRNVCDAMTSVLRDQKDAKKVIHDRGGIPHLVRLLSSVDIKVQRSSTSVLRTLAFKEDQAKAAIVEGGAVQPLIRMLRSEVRATVAVVSMHAPVLPITSCKVHNRCAMPAAPLLMVKIWHIVKPVMPCRTMPRTTRQLAL